MISEFSKKTVFFICFQHQSTFTFFVIFLSICVRARPDYGHHGGYGKKCDIKYVTVYDTIYDTSYKEKCSTHYKKKCKTVYETKYKTKYKKKCDTFYVPKCHTSYDTIYEKKCDIKYDYKGSCY